MQILQNTTDGSIWGFDDGVDPFSYPSTPTTLSANIKEKPSEAHIWVDGDWVIDPIKEKEVANNAILAQIAAIEATITPRRLRDAVLGTENGWLANAEAQITTLREQLQ